MRDFISLSDTPMNTRMKLWNMIIGMCMTSIISMTMSMAKIQPNRTHTRTATLL